MAMVITKKQYEFCDDLWGVIMSYVGVIEYTYYGWFNGKVIIDINYLRTEGDYGIFINSYKMFNYNTGAVTTHKYHINRKETALIKYKLNNSKYDYYEYPVGGKRVLIDKEELTFSPMMSNINKQVKEKICITIVDKRNKRNTQTRLIEDDVYVDGVKWSPRIHTISNRKKVEQFRTCINATTGEIRRDKRVIKPSYRIITHIDYKSNKYKVGTRIIDL